MDFDYAYEGLDGFDFGDLGIDFSQFPEIENIVGASPVDLFEGLSTEDLASLFGVSPEELASIMAGPGAGLASGAANIARGFQGGGVPNGASGTGVNDFLRLLGLGGGGGGLLGGLGGLAGLLGLGGTIFGGLNAKEATKDAQARMDKAVLEANDTVRGILGGAGDVYKPYTEAGTSALARLSALPPSDLASKFAPIGQSSALAGRFGPIGQASSLAGKFRPLGSGRGIG